MEKLCVILGAGASHDVSGGGSPVRDARFKPPLARDLFDLGSHPGFWEVISRYPGAVMLAQELAPVSARGELDLENRLREYASHQDIRIRAAYKHIPPYLRDLLRRTSRDYVDIPGSHVQLAKKMLADYPHEVMILSLNYDDLMETALSLLDPSLSMANLDDYIAADRQARVVKLHGSIDWFFPLPEGNEWFECVDGFDLDFANGFPEIVKLPDIQDLVNATHNHRKLYPALTAPMAGKKPRDAVAPLLHVESFRSFAAECRKFLVIGTSGLDEDLFQPLYEPSLANSLCQTHLVAESLENVRLTAKRFTDSVRRFALASQAQMLSVSGQGFSAYVTSEIDRFLDPGALEHLYDR